MIPTEYFCLPHWFSGFLPYSLPLEAAAPLFLQIASIVLYRQCAMKLK